MSERLKTMPERTALVDVSKQGLSPEYSSYAKAASELASGPQEIQALNPENLNNLCKVLVENKSLEMILDDKKNTVSQLSKQKNLEEQDFLKAEFAKATQRLLGKMQLDVPFEDLMATPGILPLEQPYNGDHHKFSLNSNFTASVEIYYNNYALRSYEIYRVEYSFIKKTISFSKTAAQITNESRIDKNFRYWMMAYGGLSLGSAGAITNHILKNGFISNDLMISGIVASGVMTLAFCSKLDHYFREKIGKKFSSLADVYTAFGPDVAIMLAKAASSIPEQTVKALEKRCLELKDSEREAQSNLTDKIATQTDEINYLKSDGKRGIQHYLSQLNQLAK